MELVVKKRDLRLIGKFAVDVNFMSVNGKNVMYAERDGASIVLIWKQKLPLTDVSFSLSLKNNKEFLKKCKKDNEKWYIEINENSIIIDKTEITISPISIDIIEKIKNAYRDYANSTGNLNQVFFMPEIGDRSIDFDGYGMRFTYATKNKIYWYGESDNPYDTSTSLVFSSNYIENSNINLNNQIANWF